MKEIKTKLHTVASKELVKEIEKELSSDVKEVAIAEIIKDENTEEHVGTRSSGNNRKSS